MLDQTLDDKVVELRRMAAEYFQKAAWYQILSLDNYRERNFEAAESFAQLSFEHQQQANDYADLADAESDFLLEQELEEDF